MGERYRTTFGAPFYGVQRVALLALMADALGHEHIMLGHRCVKATDDGERAGLQFEGGDSTVADVVVGADGVHSAIRSKMGGDRPAVFSGTVGYRGLVRRGDPGAARRDGAAVSRRRRPADPAPALADFEARRRDHTARVQALSRWTADMLHLTDGPEIARRDAKFSNPYRNLAWIHARDVRRPAIAVV